MYKSIKNEMEKIVSESDIVESIKVFVLVVLALAILKASSNFKDN